MFTEMIGEKCHTTVSLCCFHLTTDEKSPRIFLTCVIYTYNYIYRYVHKYTSVKYVENKLWMT